MKNKKELKKYLTIMLITTVLLTIIFTLINTYEYKTYTKNYNEKIEELLNVVKEEYPSTNELELINILNKKTQNTNINLEKYGIDITKDNVILENEKKHKEYMIINTTYITISILIIILIFITYIYQKNKKLTEITKLIEKINKKNYSLDIDSNTEDELSILKNELYKTAIMLKEQSENERIDKINLKNSLEDISHQLKTPLTSITISLDNIIENPEMDEKTRLKFIHNIKREINNINFFIRTILKLSKFDANTIEFYRKETKVKDIIKESIENVSALSDLKNIKIQINGDENIKIKCDAKWQTEAITNILKNALEHSSENGTITINYKENKIYTSISINNKGSIIDKEDLQNIFKRFYKGKNAKEDSIGIGLALTKTIIESDSGKITVTSNNKEGTTFTCKYFKN